MISLLLLFCTITNSRGDKIGWDTSVEFDIKSMVSVNNKKKEIKLADFFEKVVYLLRLFKIKPTVIATAPSNTTME